MAKQPSFWTRLGRALIGAPIDPAPKVRTPMRARAEYDGASYSRRTESWRRNGRDSNAELHPAAILALRGIAREICRNNAYGANTKLKLAQYLVGNGIRFHVYRNGVKDKALTQLARDHFESTACDADGRSNLYGLQLIAAQTCVTWCGPPGAGPEAGAPLQGCAVDVELELSTDPATGEELVEVLSSEGGAEGGGGGANSPAELAAGVEALARQIDAISGVVRDLAALPPLVV